MTFRAGIVGCGKIGSMYADDRKIRDIYTHAGAYHACPDTELAAFCDTNRNRLSACGKRWNVSALYTEIGNLLANENLDILSICTPDKTHFTMIRTAITTSDVRVIFSEKPLALKANQADELVRLAQENAVTLVVNYSRRYAKNHQQVRDLLASGRIGEIQSVNGYYTKGLLHNGTHWLDLARFFFGEIAGVRGFDFYRDRTVDPTLDAVIEFRNGVKGSLCGSDAKAFSLFEMDIIGTSGRIRIVDSGHTVEFYQAGESPFYSGYRTLLPLNVEQGGMENMLLHAVEDLVLCLKKEKDTPLCSGRDGAEAVRAALAIRGSAKTGKKVIL